MKFKPTWFLLAWLLAILAGAATLTWVSTPTLAHLRKQLLQLTLAAGGLMGVALIGVLAVLCLFAVDALLERYDAARAKKHPPDDDRPQP